MFKSALAIAVTFALTIPAHAEKASDRVGSGRKNFSKYNTQKTTATTKQKPTKQQTDVAIPNDDQQQAQPVRKNIFDKVFGGLASLVRPRKDGSQKRNTQEAKAIAEEIAVQQAGTDLPDDADADANAADLTEVDQELRDTEINHNMIFELVAAEFLNGKRLVAVVDKSVRSKKNLDGQTMIVFIDGSKVADWDVSTGRNQWETAKSGKHYFTATPARVMTPGLMVRTGYVSKTWKAPMPHAVFIRNGIAVHGTPSHEDELGHPASGGCVRLSMKNSLTFFNLVEQYGQRQTTVIIHNNGAINI